MAVRLFALLGIMIGLVAGAGIAQAGPDEGLYDPLPPEGSAFVRFIHARPGDEDEEPAIDGKAYDELNFGDVSPYVVKPAAEKAKLAFGTTETTAALEAGKFYTAVLKKDVVTVIEDPASDNRTKALLLFYNLTDKDGLTLNTADGKTEIVSSVKQGAVGSREINAVRIGFSVNEGGASVGKVEEKALDRGSAYAVIALTDADGKVKTLFAPSVTDTTK